MDTIFNPDWMTAALPLLQALGFFAAFLAGGLMAAVVGRRPILDLCHRMSGHRLAILPEAPVTAPDAGSAPVGPPLAEPKAESPREDRVDLLLGHELKNYLCAIKGNARLLRMGCADHQADVIDRIDHVVERLENLAWKGPQRSDVTACAQRTPVDVTAVSRFSSRTHFGQAAMEFSTQASEGLPAIQGDPHRLEQVFMNLYGNALEAGAKGVSTRIRRIGNEVEVAVEDDGRGCRAEDAERLFEPFYSTKVEGGSRLRGLGLFIVRSIVENHGGRIRATSKNGRGQGETGLVVYMNFPVPAVKGPAPEPLLAPVPLRPARSLARI